MTRDFNNDGFTDILWRGADGSFAIWNMDSSGTIATLGNVMAASLNLQFRGCGDVNNNGTTDIILQNSDGLIQTWNIINNEVVATVDLVGQTRNPIVTVGDFNGNNYTDLVWYTPPASIFGGVPGLWTAGTAQDRPIPPVQLGDFPGTSRDYSFAGAADFSGDGRDDMLYRGTGGPGARNFVLQEPTGELPRNGEIPVKTSVVTDPGRDWEIVKLADFDGDAKADILWRHTSGAHSVWKMDGASDVGGGMVHYPGQDWAIAAVQDYNNDGNSDIMWVHKPSGWHCQWLMDGNEILRFGASFNIGDYWSVVA